MFRGTCKMFRNIFLLNSAKYLCIIIIILMLLAIRASELRSLDFNTETDGLVKHEANNIQIIDLKSESNKNNAQIFSKRNNSNIDSENYFGNYSSYNNPGIHMAVIHPETGRILLKRSFNTRQTYTSWADLLFFLRETETGHIVSLTASGDGLYGLRYAKILLCDYGSFFTPALRINERWIWTFIKGGRTIYETIIISSKVHGKEESIYKTDSRNVSLMSSGSLISIINKDEFKEIGISSNAAIAAVTKFCSEIGAVKRVCDLKINLNINDKVKLSSVHSGPLSELTVLITAGSRPSYLLFTLSRILSAPGCPRENILVVLGSRDAHTIEMLNILRLPFVFINGESFKGNQNLFSFYRNVFEFAIRYFPFSKYFTLIDEDVEVSSDYFLYLNQTLDMLDDPTLYCINAHTLVTDLNQVRGAEFLRRGETQMYWGFAVKKEFVLELLSKWSNENEHNYLYDYWIFRVIRESRECIYPDVGRVRHYGLGFNTHLSNHEFEGWARPFLSDFGTQIIGKEKLLHEPFENDLVKTIKNAIKLKTTKPWLQDLKYGNYLVFFYMEDATDIFSWYVLASCLGLHMTNEQGHHKGLFISYSQGKDNESFSWSTDPFDASRDPRVRATHLTEDYEINQFKYKRDMEIQPTFYFIGVPFSKYSFLYKESQDYLINYEELPESEVSSIIESCKNEINVFINPKYNYDFMINSLFLS